MNKGAIMATTRRTARAGQPFEKQGFPARVLSGTKRISPALRRVMLRCRRKSALFCSICAKELWGVHCYVSRGAFLYTGIVL